MKGAVSNRWMSVGPKMLASTLSDVKKWLLSLESDRPPWYGDGLRFDNWEMSGCPPRVPCT